MMVPTATTFSPRGTPTIIIKSPQKLHQLQDKKKYSTTAERWELQQLALTCLCHVQSLQDLPKIWADLAPLNK